MRGVPSFKQPRSSKGKSILPSAVGPSTLRASTLAHHLLSSSPSSSRDSVNALIDFNGWDDGLIFDWYHDYRGERSTVVRKLQHRKERDNFKHEFIVIFTDNGLMHRIDRRPMGGASVDAIWAKGCEAEDTIIRVTKDDLKTIESETDLEIEVEFGSQKPDLYTIIAICVSIRMDKESRRYTLQRYNCYFMARTIIVLTTRHYILEHSPALSDNLRWDALTEQSISTHVFKEDWTPLDNAMRNALIATLEKAFLPIIDLDVKMLVDNRKHQAELEMKSKAIIRDTVTEMTGDLVESPVKEAVIKWAIEATQANPWRDDIEARLSEISLTDLYGNSAQSALTQSVRSHLAADLPDKIGDILPKRLLNRLPPSLLASLPPELIARLPTHFLERLPDEVVLNTPDGFLLRAPDEYFRKLPVALYMRSPTGVVLDLPDDLGRLPNEILDASLERMQMALDGPEEKDRILALKLLKRLPEHILQRVPAKYWAMRDEEFVGGGVEVVQSVAQNEPIPRSPRSRGPLGKNPLEILILTVPRFLYNYVPGILAEIFPMSWYRTLSTEALEALPSRYISRFRPSFLAAMPQELLERVPPSFLKNVPQKTLEKLPDDFLTKVPVQLLRNIPEELLTNLPEKVSDILRREIEEKIFESGELKAELIDHVANILKSSLRHASGIFFEPAIRVSIRKMKNNKIEIVRTHEDLQRHILDMVRRHSKMVAQVSHMGIGEDAVYDSLRQKTEVVWATMRPHAMPPSVR